MLARMAKYYQGVIFNKAIPDNVGSITHGLAERICVYLIESFEP
jgi:hypothetical protein